MDDNTSLNDSSLKDSSLNDSSLNNNSLNNTLLNESLETVINITGTDYLELPRSSTPLNYNTTIHTDKANRNTASIFSEISSFYSKINSFPFITQNPYTFRIVRTISFISLFSIILLAIYFNVISAAFFKTQPTSIIVLCSINVFLTCSLLYELDLITQLGYNKSKSITLFVFLLAFCFQYNTIRLFLLAIYKMKSWIFLLTLTLFIESISWVALNNVKNNKMESKLLIFIISVIGLLCVFDYFKFLELIINAPFICYKVYVLAQQVVNYYEREEGFSFHVGMLLVIVVFISYCSNFLMHVKVDLGMNFGTIDDITNLIVRRSGL